MRRWMSAVLILCLFCMPALAENAYTLPDGVRTVMYYQHPQDGFSVACPEGWVTVDHTNLDAFMRETSSPDHPYAALYGAVAPSENNIRAYRILLLIDPATQTNVNILPQRVAGLEEMTAAEINEQLISGILAQLQGQFAGAEVLNGGSVQVFGKNEFAMIALSYNALGKQMEIYQFYKMAGQRIYTITFTAQKAVLEAQEDQMSAVLTDVLTSFAPGAD